MFEGSNKNIIVFTYKDMKNQWFDYDPATQTWFNEFTEGAIQVGNTVEIGSNVGTGSVKKGTASRQKWKVEYCTDLKKGKNLKTTKKGDDTKEKEKIKQDASVTEE